MQIKVMVPGQWRWQELGAKQLTATHGHPSLSSPCTKLNFQIYIKAGQALWDMICRHRMQPALNKMQKDLACSQPPKSEPQGRVWVQLTVCFSVGGKPAHVLDAGHMQWIPLRLIYPCKNTSSTLWRVSPPKWEPGAAMRQHRLLLPTCQAWQGRPMRGKSAPAPQMWGVCSADGCKKATKIKGEPTPWACA